MDFILISVKYKEKINPYLNILKDFSIKIRESKVSGKDFIEEYLLKEYIITLNIEELVKLRDIFDKSILIENYYYDSEMEIHENINVLRIYDDYIDWLKYNKKNNFKVVSLGNFLF